MALIAIDGRRAFHGSTGLGNYTVWVIRELMKLDHLSFIIYTHAKPPPDLNLPTNFRVVPAALSFIHNSLWSHLEIPVRIRFQKPDVFWAPAQFVPLFMPQGVKCMVTVHDIIPIVHPEFNSPRYNLYMRKMLSYSANRSNFILTVSKASRYDIINHLKIPPEKVEVLYPPVPAPPLTDENTKVETVKRLTGLKRDKFFLFVGKMELRKNLHGIIEAMDVLKRKKSLDFSLVVVGGKAWGGKIVFETLKKSSLDTQDVIFTGTASEQLLHALYSTCRALVLPSFYEGFGLPIAEAILHKKPVIVSNISACPEVAGDAGIKVNPHSTEEIAEALNCLSSDQTLYENLLARAIEREQFLRKEAESFSQRIGYVFQRIMDM